MEDAEIKLSLADIFELRGIQPLSCKNNVVRVCDVISLATVY